VARAKPVALSPFFVCSGFWLCLGGGSKAGSAATVWLVRLPGLATAKKRCNVLGALQPVLLQVRFPELNYRAGAADYACAVQWLLAKMGIFTLFNSQYTVIMPGQPAALAPSVARLPTDR
jgi:hypothetical protein